MTSRSTTKPVQLDRAAAKCIVKLLGLAADEKPSEALRQVRNCIAIYRQVVEFQQGAPSAAEIRIRIVKLGRNAERMLSELSALQPFLESLPPRPNEKTPYRPDAMFKPELSRLAAVASMARRVKLSSGHPKDRAREFLILELASLFHDCTGKKPAPNWHAIDEEYRGRFFGLVSVCLDAAGEPISDAALGQAIKRALEGWKPA